MWKKGFLSAAVVLILISRVFGQANDFPRGIRPFHGLDLTEEQSERIEAFHTEAMQETLPLQTKLKTLRAELDELLIVDMPNRRAIEEKVDEMSALRTTVQKRHIDTRLAIREMLTDEQRTKFDAMRMHRPHGGSMRHGGRGRRGGMRGGAHFMHGDNRRPQRSGWEQDFG